MVVWYGRTGTGTTYAVKKGELSLHAMSSNDHMVSVDNAAATDVQAKITQGDLPRELIYVGKCNNYKNKI